MKVYECKTAGARGQVVCPRCAVADSPLTRLRGLMGRRTLPRGHGLLLRPAPSIHTFFMRFAIDAVFVDRDLNVLSVRPAVAPWRTAGQRGARAVLELPAGEAARMGVAEGTRLELGRPVDEGRAGRRKRGARDAA